MMEKRIDKASNTIRAAPATIYSAFATQDAFQSWLPPSDMEGQVTEFNFQHGCGYRMRLTYNAEEYTNGKTIENSDEVIVRFIRLIPKVRIEQVVNFVSEQDEFKGEMKMTWTFEEREDGTRVTVTCVNVPDGIKPEDHETGLKINLGNLAKFAEKQS